MVRVKGKVSGQRYEETSRRASKGRRVKKTKYAAPVEKEVVLILSEDDTDDSHDDPSLESKQDEIRMTATLTDTDVFDCSICMKPLSPPVFQCENGHIACSPCCTQLANKCPSCSCPVGKIRCLAMEKVIDSIKVSCMYEPYGCTETFCYIQKETHEETCIFTPCKCPFKDCDFKGSSKQLSLHISSKHSNFITQISFNHPIHVSFHKLESFAILQEVERDVLFVLNNHTEPIGSAISVECLGRSPSNGGFRCEIISRKGDTSLKLESHVECVRQRTETSSSLEFLLVPYYVDDKVSLEIQIWVRS